jgi:GT2 family glycosyltransferase
MYQYHWLRNTLRHTFQGTTLGRAWLNLTSTQTPSICFVSATRLSEKDFWRKSLLGPSLRNRLNNTTVTTRIAFENSRGLPEVYNEAIRKEKADILVFLHDDVSLHDTQILQKIRAALKFNDVVGVAGNQRRLPNQPAWAFLKNEKGELVWDNGHLSGSIQHGTPGKSTTSYFGPSPATCALMDGVFLAANRHVLLKSNALFGNEFKFHFYDMDFCRSVSRAGLRMSTWPIDLIHESGGAFNTESWKKMEAIYLQKWRS